MESDNYLSNIVAKSLNLMPVIQPRPFSIFEPIEANVTFGTESFEKFPSLIDAEQHGSYFTTPPVQRCLPHQSMPTVNDEQTGNRSMPVESVPQHTATESKDIAPSDQNSHCKSIISGDNRRKYTKERRAVGNDTVSVNKEDGMQKKETIFEMHYNNATVNFSHEIESLAEADRKQIHSSSAPDIADLKIRVSHQVEKPLKKSE